MTKKIPQIDYARVLVKTFYILVGMVHHMRILINTFKEGLKILFLDDNHRSIIKVTL